MAASNSDKDKRASGDKRKPQGKTHRVQLKIPRLNQEGIEAAKGLADCTLNGCRPHEIGVEWINAEVDRLMGIGDTDNLREEIHRLVAASVGIARLSVPLASWAIRADRFLERVPAMIAGTAGDRLRSMNPDRQS